VLELWPAWSARGGAGQYPAGSGGDQYPVGGSGGSHVGGYPTVTDPPHGITGVGLV
jgi:hypothetical protein